MDERQFFDERQETRQHSLTCPHCSVTAIYTLGWTVRRKRQQPPRNADDQALAKFRKAQSYMVRREDQVTCNNQRCGRRFEITGLQTVADLVDTSVLPADHKDKGGPAPAEDRAAALRARFARKTYN